ncbi:multidrug efflux SMR transporter [Fortiea sp. LEGE XX443]|uniref:DMT family transporter n=1 Tax=Fortiea sp. LEGE XX443 TaxID=1828611 RepID=UPI00188211C0|nr:multidrug efflux SMR transporter [Fortiea sp. LEGE XX443]MBE9007495.1 multidrug efflux SMR transporter [Fortiea sp. LEGE XX443]
MTTSWLYLITAILFEVAATTSMKLSEGFTRTIPSVLIFICYGICFSFLTLAIKKIEVNVAYSIGSGLGTALIASIGVIWFRESMSLVKFLSIALIIVGVVGINSAK